MNPENISVLSALDEFYETLSAAFDSDGVDGFNSATLNWQVTTPDEAEAILDRVDHLLIQYVIDNVGRE